MPLDVEKLKAAAKVDLEHSYDQRDAILYALSVGLGDTLDEARDYLYEGAATLCTMPSLATVIVPDLFPPGLGWDYDKVVHLEQRLQLFRPLPERAELNISKRVGNVLDRGARVGALIEIEAEARRRSDDTAVFALTSTILARGDGGFGGDKGRPQPAHRPPSREPDFICALPTRQDQALLYRLNGDLNPLHADPSTAVGAGFERPILHGLCTYGTACHAILKTICAYDHTLVSELNARFAQPVYPGETITTRLWQEGNVVSFECVVDERDVVALKNGYCLLKA